MFGFKKKNKKQENQTKTLFGATLNTQHKVKSIIQDDKEMAYFLNTLGCFEGEPITIVSVLSDTYVIALKDARYSIDSDLAKTVVIH
ncbi:FeoA domain-containing protein [Photobacterium nomapromontoriensis]|uniref:FeoA domain-containing protein n=1 Tax=Photobacterium nomapromontoriensis TaxID=2910237 RepID=UPI003D13B426